MGRSEIIKFEKKPHRCIIVSSVQLLLPLTFIQHALVFIATSQHRQLKGGKENEE